MNIEHGGEGQMPPQREHRPTHEPVGNVRWQDARDIFTDHRLLIGSESIREGVEVAPAAAVDICGIQFATFAGPVTHACFNFVIVRAPVLR